MLRSSTVFAVFQWRSSSVPSKPLTHSSSLEHGSWKETLNKIKIHTTSDEDGTGRDGLRFKLSPLFLAIFRQHHNHHHHSTESAFMGSITLGRVLFQCHYHHQSQPARTHRERAFLRDRPPQPQANKLKEKDTLKLNALTVGMLGYNNSDETLSPETLEFYSSHYLGYIEESG